MYSKGLWELIAVSKHRQKVLSHGDSFGVFCCEIFIQFNILVNANTHGAGFTGEIVLVRGLGLLALTWQLTNYTLQVHTNAHTPSIITYCVITYIIR